MFDALLYLPSALALPVSTLPDTPSSFLTACRSNTLQHVSLHNQLSLDAWLSNLFLLRAREKYVGLHGPFGWNDSTLPLHTQWPQTACTERAGLCPQLLKSAFGFMCMGRVSWNLKNTPFTICAEIINVVWDRFNKMEKVLLLNNVNRYTSHQKTRRQLQRWERSFSPHYSGDIL